MQEGVREAEADAAPPDPALHERKVSDLEAACGESLTRIASLENEIRYVDLPPAPGAWSFASQQAWPGA